MDLSFSFRCSERGTAQTVGSEQHLLDLGCFACRRWQSVDHGMHAKCINITVVVGRSWNSDERCSRLRHKRQQPASRLAIVLQHTA